jgi:hypothetical protein
MSERTMPKADNLHAPPLVPADLSLRDFSYMPLDVVRLRDSGSVIELSGDEFRAALLLWCAAWHQVPASSLPNDDRVLANLAGYGRAVKPWLKVKTNALRGFHLCTDGRLYHPVIAEKALEADSKRWKRRKQTEAATAARRSHHDNRVALHDDDRDDNRNDIPNDQRNVDRNGTEEKGTKRSELNAVSEAVASGANAPSQTLCNERQYFSGGKRILGSNSGGLLAKLLKSKNNDCTAAWSVVETASLKENPAEYVGAIVVRGNSSRGKQGGFVEILAEKHMERHHVQRTNS